MAQFLIFKVSGNGQPRKWTLPASDTFNWPRMIHLAWETYDGGQKLLTREDHIIKPRGFELSSEVEQRSGITNEMASKGDDLVEVLALFRTAVQGAEIIFAHNLNFNESVIGAECIRLAIPNMLIPAEKYCLMQESTYFCRLKGRGGKFKWPSLTELFQILFKSKYEGPGNATNDLLASSACLFRLINLRQLDDIFE